MAWRCTKFAFVTNAIQFYTDLDTSGVFLVLSIFCFLFFSIFFLENPFDWELTKPKTFYFRVQELLFIFVVVCFRGLLTLWKPERGRMREGPRGWLYLCIDYIARGIQNKLQRQRRFWVCVGRKVNG